MRYLLILLFISFNSFGQGIDPNPITYKNLMQIDSEAQFKRVMIENGYEFVEDGENETYIYARHPKKTKKREFKRTGKKTKKLDSPAWTWYHPDTNTFMFNFTKTLTNGLVNENNTYDKIFSVVKRKCEFVKIQTITTTDFACYTCPDTSFQGYLGFHSDRESGTIMRIGK